MSRRPKTARRRWHHWTEAEASAVLDDFTTAGLTPTEFCALRGISRGRLAYWRERLSASPPASVPVFVEVAQPVPPHREAHIEILRGGERARLLAGQACEMVEVRVPMPSGVALPAAMQPGPAFRQVVDAGRVATRTALVSYRAP